MGAVRALLLILVLLVQLFQSCEKQTASEDMFGSSRLTKELTTWIKRGGDLGDVLTARGYEVSSKKEASAVVAAIEHLQATRSDSDQAEFSSPLHRLTAFFQRVNSQEAFVTLARDGLPLLRHEIERALAGNGPSSSDALFIMKILAMYRQKEDVELIVRVARAGYEKDGYMWSVVFGEVGDDHPNVGQFIDALREPLPDGFMGVAFLDLCNGLAIEGELARSSKRVWVPSDKYRAFGYERVVLAAY